jgi:hypothetical protein
MDTAQKTAGVTLCLLTAISAAAALFLTRGTNGGTALIWSAVTGAAVVAALTAANWRDALDRCGFNGVSRQWAALDKDAITATRSKWPSIGAAIGATLGPALLAILAVKLRIPAIALFGCFWGFVAGMTGAAGLVHFGLIAVATLKWRLRERA